MGENIAVDPYCVMTNAKVYLNYSCILNLADVTRNSNKFYIMQIITTSTEYHLYIRYGRVGEKGVVINKTNQNLPHVTKEFKTKYKQKTGCEWGKESAPIPGKYYLIDLEIPEVKVQSPPQTNDVFIDPQVQTLLDNLTNKASISKIYHSFAIDEKRLPLGKISSQQISKANNILSQIETNLEIGSLEHLSSQFWSLVPYVSGRNKPPPVINTKEMVKQYVDFLEILNNLKVTKEVINLSIQQKYQNLGLEIFVLEDEDEKKMLAQYISESHAPSHKYKLKINKMFAIKQPTSKPQENSHLLFHGSRTTNFYGILKEGLRVPSSIQIVNGAALGKGIYFADCVTKSFNYCYEDRGYVLVSEVYLGDNPEYLNKATFDLTPKTGYTSRIAEGKYEYERLICKNGVMMPEGRMEESSKPFRQQSSFLYNEYVVFDATKYVPRYLIELEKI